jgi:hypothetical protein
VTALTYLSSYRRLKNLMAQIGEPLGIACTKLEARFGVTSDNSALRVCRNCRKALMIRFYKRRNMPLTNLQAARYGQG